MSDYFLFPTQALWERAVGPFKKGWKTNGIYFGSIAASSLRGPVSPLFKEFWLRKLAQVWELVEGS